MQVIWLVLAIQTVAIVYLLLVVSRDRDENQAWQGKKLSQLVQMARLLDDRFTYYDKVLAASPSTPERPMVEKHLHG